LLPHGFVQKEKLLAGEAISFLVFLFLVGEMEEQAGEGILVSPSSFCFWLSGRKGRLGKRSWSLSFLVFVSVWA
jgi:hypothetical protein